MASVSNTKGTNQDSRVQVPLGFLETLGGTIGHPFSVNELIGSLPTTQSLFGGGSVGLLPANQYGPPAQAGTGTSAVQGTANAGTFTPRQLMTVASGLGGPEKSKTQALINDAISSGRLSWDQNLSTSDLNNLLSSPGSGIDNPRRLAGMLVSPAQAIGGGQQQRVGGYTPEAPLPIDFSQGARNLGFGQSPPTYQQFQFANVPGINAPNVQAAQGTIAPQGFDRYENALFESQYRPQERELNRLGDIADRRLQGQTTLESLQPNPEFWYAAIGLRLKEPETSKAMVDLVYYLFPGRLMPVLEWQYVKENASLANTLNAMFMGLFSILGLAAVGMIIFNTIGGQVLSHYREIALLKAVGFSPRHVTLLFLSEHLTIGLIAALVGILHGLLVAPGLVGKMAENLNTAPPDIYAPLPLIGILIMVEAAVALATLLPAWQGGRIDTVEAISVGYRSRYVHQSRLGQLAGWLRLPPVIVLGVKDTFLRPLRSVLAIASLLLSVMVVITAVGAQTTTGYLARNRFYFNGTTADMKVP